MTRQIWLSFLLVSVVFLFNHSCGSQRGEEPNQESVASLDASAKEETSQELVTETPSPTETMQEKTTSEPIVQPDVSTNDRVVAEEAPSDTPTSKLTVEEVCSQVATARCKPFFGCCQGVTLPFSDLADCVGKLKPSCISSAAKEIQALATGHAFISEKHLQDCLAAFANGEKQCRNAAPETLKVSCALTYQDKAAVGEECLAKQARLACANGVGLCVQDGGSSITCKALAKEGEECSITPCVSGLLCMQSSGGASTCRIPGGEGTACNGDSFCQPQLRCSEQQKCVAPLKEGDSCQRAGQCDDAFACNLDEKKCVKRVAQDQPCIAHPQCQKGLRCLGLALKGSCVPKGKAGDKCENAQQCAEGLTCDTKSTTCKELAKKDESCLSGNDCDKGLGCDGQNQVCVELPAEGKTCLVGVKECAEGLSCYSTQKGQGVCQKPTTEGTNCTKDTNCQSGLGCAAGKCTKLPTAGQKCLDGRLCQGSYCDFKTGLCNSYLASGSPCQSTESCGPNQSCGPNNPQDPKSLACMPVPKAGETCLVTCTDGLFCKRALQPGTCKPEVCSL